MKKYLLWIPIIGLFTTFYYQVIKGEWIVNSDKPLHFFGSSIYQAISISILILFLIKY